MNEKALKIVPAPEARMSPDKKVDASSRGSAFERFGRKRLRIILLDVLPLLAFTTGLGLYLSGGRYISTDNAYVGGAEGADHTRHLRQDHACRHSRRATRQSWR